jgi:hypothetical protein
MWEFARAFVVIALISGLLWWIGGCAAGHVTPEGVLWGAAIGDGAFVQSCQPHGEANAVEAVIHGARETCSRIEGAPILPSLLDGAVAVIKAALSWLPF